jgi:hypothetical protein
LFGFCFRQALETWGFEDDYIKLVSNKNSKEKAFYFETQKRNCFKCQIFIARAFATYQVLNKTDEPIGTSLLSKIKVCLDFMDKNVRVNQTELDRLQQEQEKLKNKSKRVLTKAGLKTTGLDDGDDDMRSTSTSESSSESSSSVDDDDDDDDDDDEGFDFEQLWETIRRDVADKMEYHLKKKKPLPKLPPHKNDLPTGVCRVFQKYQSQIRCHGKTRYIGTWSKPEQAAKAFLFTKDALRELKNKKTISKKQKLLQKKKKAEDEVEVDDESRSRSGNDNDNDIIHNSAGRAYTDNNADDVDPHMAHFDRIRRRTTILPCRDREKELLMSFRIMQKEMQILFRRVSFFKTQLEDRQHRQIFKDEIKERIMKEE